jgi:hypothetical protein
VYNEEVCGCSSAAVRRSTPAVGTSIGAVVSPAVALPDSCSALIRAGLSQGHCQAGPWEKRADARHDRSVHGDPNMMHICVAFASPRMARTRCVAPLKQDADVFSVRVCVAPLEMP